MSHSSRFPHPHDSPGHTTSSLSPERGLVGAFQKNRIKLTDNHGVDRRAALRYTSRSVRVVISWIGEAGREHCNGRLCDISMGGALVAVERFPPESAVLWMRLKSGDPNQWVEVINLGPPPKCDDTRRLRLSFPTGCPYEIFRRSVWGHDSAEADPSAAGQAGKAT